MAQVHINDDSLIVELQGLHKLWTLKSRLQIPLSRVRGATADPGAISEPKGLRAPGTHVPGLLTAGTFHLDGERIFWDVHDPAKTIVIELADNDYRRLVIEVPDPRATVALIERSLPPT